ncbi:MAG: histidine phosphatase family protein [Candidatus Rokubacteria bacterium]|nr:histidine phosphatase family protein [Candidatus Rokubacteria bacterium]MBI3104835.1 histidine phosphatase family protein [Candidatus Rokubacteria bacterium]
MQDLTPTVVYLVRHGAVVGAESRRFIGHLDVPLSAHGEAELEALAKRLAGVQLAAVYSSDLSRTRRSAEILAAPHGLVAHALPELREFAMGRWEGLTAEEIRALDPPAFAEWMAAIGRFQFPDGENLAQVARRAWRAFEGIVAAHPGEQVAVVAHGGTNRAILCRALGIPLERILTLGQDYAGLSMLEAVGEGWRLRLLNHREPVLAPSPRPSPPGGGGSPGASAIMPAAQPRRTS